MSLQLIGNPVLTSGAHSICDRIVEAFLPYLPDRTDRLREPIWSRELLNCEARLVAVLINVEALLEDSDCWVS